AQPGELSFPNYVPSKAGDFVMVSQEAKVLQGKRHALSFRERDDFTGPTSGYHFKQLLVNGKVVWEEDVAGGTNDWRRVEVDLSRELESESSATLAFRLFDKKAVGNFGVRWRLKDLEAD